MGRFENSLVMSLTDCIYLSWELFRESKHEKTDQMRSLSWTGDSPKFLHNPARQKPSSDAVMVTELGSIRWILTMHTKWSISTSNVVELPHSPSYSNPVLLLQAEDAFSFSQTPGPAKHTCCLAAGGWRETSDEKRCYQSSCSVWCQSFGSWWINFKNKLQKKTLSIWEPERIWCLLRLRTWVWIEIFKWAGI